MLDLAKQLADKDSLLLLDNCDRFTDGVGDLAADLLARCPGIRMPGTSRTPLALSAGPPSPSGTCGRWGLTHVCGLRSRLSINGHNFDVRTT